MRQQDRVLAALTRGPVCADTEWTPRIKRLPARIYDLGDEGWDITTVDCPLHGHATWTIAYVLHNSPGVLQPDLAEYATPPPPPEQPILDILTEYGYDKPYGFVKVEMEER